MSRTKAELRTLNMSADRWQALADKAREIVPDDEKPANANTGSDWQRTAALRGWADGVYTMVRTDELEALRAKVDAVAAERDELYRLHYK